MQTVSTPTTLEETKAIFNAIKDIAIKYGPLLFLAQLILDKEHGARHGKMGTKSTEEDMWTTGFARAGILAPPTCTQADCSIRCPEPLPLSIKCTKSVIAVNWGKNKEKVHFVFNAAIMIIWHGKTDPGLYVVDPMWCQENIAMGSNNKTDYMVSTKDVTKMRVHAREEGMFVPLTALPDDNTYFVFRNGTQGYAWPRLLSDVAPESA